MSWVLTAIKVFTRTTLDEGNLLEFFVKTLWYKEDDVTVKPLSGVVEIFK